MTNEGLLDRIRRDTGVAELVEVLAERLSPTDLQSLMLEVYRQRAAKVTPARLIEQYEQNRFVCPSSADPRRRVEVERMAWAALPRGYEPIDLSPVAPLGTCSAIATVDQHKVLTTSRNTEVASDSTNVLALECAVRRRASGRPDESVRLATSHRVLRTPLFKGPRSFAHFGILALVAAGRDLGSHRFETAHLAEQLGFYLTLLERLKDAGGAFVSFRVTVTLLAGGPLAPLIEEKVLAPLAELFPEVTLQFDPERESGRGYYSGVCFKIFGTTRAGEEMELGDGGMADWTQKLLANRKERLLIGCISLERLCAVDG